MPRKTRWFITLFFLLLFGGLFVLRASWQPWLFDLITPRQDRLEGFKLVLDLLNGAGGLITILFALGMWLSGRVEKTPPSNRLDEILVPATPDKLFETYVVPAQVKGQVLPWIDTGTVTTADLRASQVLVIAGPMKSGKSREAVELLRRAEAEGIVSPARLYDVSESWRRLPPEALEAELQSRLDFGSPVVLYLNQLPVNCGEKEIEALDLLKKAIEAKEVTADWIRQDPDWEDLRKDPRFMAMVGDE